ncbi:hypothetical protein NW762_008985 [Fusarium torreyae]|uniref:NAD(P)-binding domain-containing protein n=1 Tax=Fusarium torreyae TaxID=1237075 RepID=A0A9W8VBU6_9HYPO|nr:hypothetical protein NW762_008985 [Fusarium torreyae]
MVKVAIAGGSGHIGRTLVDAIKETTSHEVLILSRKPNPEVEAETRVPVIDVDYSDVNALTRLLEEQRIHTVVSAITMMQVGFGQENNEISLIRAADASTFTKRMIATDWGFPHHEGQIAYLASIGPKLEAHKFLKSVKNIKSTIVQNGYLMDYWGMPTIKSHMQSSTLILDIPNNSAGIPGTGDEAVIFSYSGDVANLVAALLDSDDWDPVSHVVGDKLTWHEFLRLAEDVKGTNFDVSYDSIDKLKQGQITELPGHVPTYPFFPKEALQSILAGVSLMMAEGSLDYETPKTLNERFPSIKTMKVREMLEQAWR